MNIEQIEISIGARLASLPKRQNAKAKLFHEARAKLKEKEQTIVQEVINSIVPKTAKKQKPLNAEQDLTLASKIIPEVFPAPEVLTVPEIPDESIELTVKKIQEIQI